MKRLKIKAVFVLFCIAISVSLFANSPRLIIRSDDMGAFHSVNVASIDTYVNGITTSVEVMPVAAWFPEAVKMLNEYPGLDVGIHVAVTSEWENVKWSPLTCAPSLTDENGYFYPMIWPNKSYPKQTLLENDWKLSELEAEYRAQIELVLKNIPHASHLSGHMGSLNITPEISNMVQKLADEYGLIYIEGTEGKKYNLKRTGFDGPKNSPQEKEDSFIKALQKLEDGQAYLFVEHPALDNIELESVGHIGYSLVGYDRQGITDLLKSDKVKKVIKERGIQLISYKELK